MSLDTTKFYEHTASNSITELDSNVPPDPAEWAEITEAEYRQRLTAMEERAGEASRQHAEALQADRAHRARTFYLGTRLLLGDDNALSMALAIDPTFVPDEDD